MATHTDQRKTQPTSAQLRHDIDRGATGDKTPALDPAAAPLGTDEEAGGAPPTPPEIADAMTAERRDLSGERNAVAPEITPDGERSSSKGGLGVAFIWIMVLALATLLVWYFVS